MARKLRLEGISMREIERRVGVARSTVSLWVRDIAGGSSA
jgi:transposase